MKRDALTAHVEDVIGAFREAEAEAVAMVGASSNVERRRLASLARRKRREARWRWVLRNTARTDQRPTVEEVAGAVVLPRYRRGERGAVPVDVAPTSAVDAGATMPSDAPMGGHDDPAGGS